MEAKLDMVLEQVGRDKNIDKSVLINALEQAILTAAKRTFGLNREMEAKFNADTGSVDLFLIVNVVDEDDAIEGREITVAQASSAGLEAELGDELLFQVFYRSEDDDRAKEQDEKFGNLIDLKNASKKFGRIAAQTAKQVIYQRVREAERDNVFNDFKDRKGEIISGAVRRFERGALVVDVGKAEAVLPMREQVPRESYRVGDAIKAYCLDIDRNARGPQVILSRTHKGLLEKLFEQEVPEIFEKIVRIESSAREPGARAKIAVSSRDRDVDPVGACVGMKGSRVQAVVQELRGEKIDIVPYDDDPARFVCNAIAPAEVSRVIIDAEGHRMELIVPRRQAVARDRQEGPERPARVAADRLAHRHPQRVEDLRARAPREGADRHRDRRRGLRGQRVRQPVQAGLAIGRRARTRTRRGAGRLAGHRRSRGRAEGHRRREGVPGRRHPSPGRREARGRAPLVAHRREAAARARRRRRGRARGARHREHPLAGGSHQDPDRARRDHDGHRHGRSRSAPPAGDQLALRGQLLKAAPRRTCVGCRNPDDQSALVRLAADGARGDGAGRIVVDAKRLRPGRGAYVHRGCASKLEKGQIARTLKRAVDGRDVAAIVSELSSDGDNSGDRTIQNGGRFSRGATPAIPVRTAPRISAKE